MPAESAFANPTPTSSHASPQRLSWVLLVAGKKSIPTELVGLVRWFSVCGEGWRDVFVAVSVVVGGVVNYSG